MKNSIARKLTLGLLLCSSLQVLAATAEVKQVIDKARVSYYALKDQGLKTFHCNVEPDWRKFLEGVTKKPVAADDPQLNRFKDLRFSVAIDEEGQSTITPFMVNGGNIDPALSQMIDGFKQMLAGFYQTWTALVLKNPFHEVSDSITLRQEGDNFRLLSKDGGSDVEIVLNKDYAMSEMKVMSAGSKVVMFPKYTKTAKGLLLTDIDSTIDDGKQRIVIGITYQNIQGFNLPGHASFRVTLPDQVVAVEIAFSQYQLATQ